MNSSKNPGKTIVGMGVGRMVSRSLPSVIYQPTSPVNVPTVARALRLSGAADAPFPVELSPAIPDRLAGRTSGFGPLNEGSNPSPGAVELRRRVRYLTVFLRLIGHDRLCPAFDPPYESAVPVHADP